MNPLVIRGSGAPFPFNTRSIPAASGVFSRYYAHSDRMTRRAGMRFFRKIPTRK
jgi:hypothetical protein